MVQEEAEQISVEEDSPPCEGGGDTMLSRYVPSRMAWINIHSVNIQAFISVSLVHEHDRRSLVYNADGLFCAAKMNCSKMIRQVVGVRNSTFVCRHI